MIRWVLHCARCSKSWEVFRDRVDRRDWACPYCGAGGVRIKDEEGT